MRVRNGALVTEKSALTDNQEQALRRLCSEGVLTAEQADAVRVALNGADQRPPAIPLAQRLTEVLGYLGGGLMMGGATLLVATSWEDLSRPARITVLVAVSAALITAGILVSGGPSALRSAAVPPARLRLTSVLLALSAGTWALAAGTVASSGEVLWGALVGLAVAIAGYLVVPSVAGVAAAAVLSTIAAGQVVLDVLEWDARALAVAYVLLGLAWGGLAVAGVLTQPWAGFTTGAAIALLGAQQPVGTPSWSGWAYALTTGVALVCFLTYLRARSAVLLVAGVVGITIAVPEAIWDWTDGAVGGAAIVLVTGAVLLAGSWTGLRLRR